MNPFSSIGTCLVFISSKKNNNIILLPVKKMMFSHDHANVCCPIYNQTASSVMFDEQHKETKK